MDGIILLVSSSSVAMVICALAIWWLWKNGYLESMSPSSKGASGPGKALPTPPLKRGGNPWNVQFVTSEENLSISQGKLRISYKAGKIGAESGGSIHANPFNSLPADACVFSYKVFIPSNMNYVKGGKLSGMCFGQGPRDCATGSEWSNTGGSYRLMFDKDGSLYPYIYLPFGSPSKAYDAQGPNFKKNSQKVDHAGLGLWKKDSTFKLRKGQWNTISMRMSLNTPGQANGVLEATVNGVKREFTEMRWRSSAATKINMVGIISFYGGGDSSYNAPSNTSILFDDFRFST